MKDFTRARRLQFATSTRADKRWTAESEAGRKVREPRAVHSSRSVMTRRLRRAIFLSLLPAVALAGPAAPTAAPATPASSPVTPAAPQKQAEATAAKPADPAPQVTYAYVKGR